MPSINMIAVCGGLLTATLLFVTHYLPALPLWATFIAWACFYHLGGSNMPGKVFAATLIHMGFGAGAAWLTALVLLNTPWQDGWAGVLMPPVLIGIAIALILRIGSYARLSVTPAIIYGYAAIWAYLSIDGHFSMAALLSPTLQNALVAVSICIALGVCMGFINATLVSKLAHRQTV